MEVLDMRKSLVMAILGLAAGSALSTTLGAQAANQGAPQQTANPPAGSYSPRDLSGVWNALRNPYDFSSFSKGDPPMTAWGTEQFKATKPSQGSRGVVLKDTNDRVYQCYPPGMPYIYLQVFPMEIVQTPKQVIELFEYDHFVRHIYIDGRKHPDDPTPTYDGDSIGHWEGNTLVVDTIGLNGKIWLDRVGHPESDQMHITERIQRTDEKTLQIDFTFDDPKAYPAPWNATLRWGLRPTWSIMEHICEENRGFDEFEK
jgi:hypothetical protein